MFSNDKDTLFLTSFTLTQKVKESWMRRNENFSNKSDSLILSMQPKIKNQSAKLPNWSLIKSLQTISTDFDTRFLICTWKLKMKKRRNFLFKFSIKKPVMRISTEIFTSILSSKSAVTSSKRKIKEKFLQILNTWRVTLLIEFEKNARLHLESFLRVTQ